MQKVNRIQRLLPIWKKNKDQSSPHELSAAWTVSATLQQGALFVLGGTHTYVYVSAAAHLTDCVLQASKAWAVNTH
jgi:hypothetical protein